MVYWGKQCGIETCDGFDILPQQLDNTFPPTTDWTTMATQDLYQDDPVLYVSGDMILSSQNLRQELGYLHEAEEVVISLTKGTDSDTRLLIEYLYLIVKILYELQQGESSAYYPWLQSLPQVFSNGASMTQTCFDCLPPLASKLALKERSHLQALVKSRALSKLPFPINTDYAEWAFNIIATRSMEEEVFVDCDLEQMSDEEEPILNVRIVPIADYFNHDSDPNVYLNFDEAGNCFAQAIRDVPVGSPLTIQYADPTNPSFLLARYGFLDESAPATYCKYEVAHADAKLKDIGYAENRMLFYPHTGEVSNEVFNVLLYKFLNAKQRRDLYQAVMTGNVDLVQAFQEEFWPQTSRILLEHIDGFVGELDRLNSKAYKFDVSQHPRLPLILKHNQFVRDTFLRVRERYFGDY